jgi:site-specific DNA-methyltransferase (adenine-specific)
MTSPAPVPVADETVRPWVERREIGPCTLFLGDFRDVVATFAPASIDMVLTDPPYGHNNNNGDLIANREKATGRGTPGKPRPIVGDGEEADAVFGQLIDAAARLLKSPGCCCCCCCCCCGGGPDPLFARWALRMDQALAFKQAVVWDKGAMGMGWHYRRSYEFMLVAEKRGGKSKWYDTSRRIENIIRSKGCANSPGIGKLIPRAEQHPTEKPVALGEWFIRLHAQPGDLVLDPMMGSGAFVEAALRLGNRAIGIEIDPGHYATACARIEKAWAEANA